MDFQYSDTVIELQQRVSQFMDQHVYPAEKPYKDALAKAESRWTVPAIMEELKQKAKEAELWNLWLPESELGAGLSNLEYAPLAEIMGRSFLGPETFNCSAPDTGNMEVLVRYGTEAHKKQWLEPLLDGTIRSAFCMTEPDVASSDATNIRCSIQPEGDDYVINGTKWYSSGAMDPRTKILIVMGKTNPEADRHRQQSMILVPMEAQGVEVIRACHVFGNDDAPHGHAEVKFTNVRVSKDNLLLGEGRGFEIAQGRLGPGRIHHCMRLVGCAQRALELMCARAEERIAFGRKLSAQGSLRQNIALSRCEIDQARLLTLNAADKMDKEGNKSAQDLIAMIKVVAPMMAQNVVDRAIQVHGAKGVSQDTFLPDAWLYARTIRLADGPDEVHQNALAKHCLKQWGGEPRHV